MEIGIIGLGRMGSNMVRRLMDGSHPIVVYDPVSEAVEAIVKHAAVGAASIADLAQQLVKPRAVWLMLPAGEPTESTIDVLG